MIAAPIHAAAMKRPIAAAVALLSILLHPELARSDASPSDRTIVPGVRVGVISRGITESRLAELVGRGRLRRVLYPNGEGGSHCATEVFPDVSEDRPSTSRVTVIWGSDRETYLSPDGASRCDASPERSNPIEVIIEGKSTDWRTAEGLGLGVSLGELERMNGKPVTFESCECCGDGGVGDWHGGVFDSSGSVSVEVDDADVRESLGRYRDDGVTSSEITAELKSKIHVKRIVLHLPAPTED